MFFKQAEFLDLVKMPNQVIEISIKQINEKHKHDILIFNKIISLILLLSNLNITTN